MPMNRGQWVEYLRPGARKAFSGKYTSLTAQYPQLFNVETSSRAFEDDLQASGFGTAAIRPEGNPVLLDQAAHRGKVRYIHAGYGLGFEVTQEAMDDDLYNIVPKNAGALGPSMRDTEEVIAAGILNNAFTTVLTYDGQPLVSTAHTTATAATQSNRPAADDDIGLASLQEGIEHFLDMEDDRGLKIQGFFPTMLVHSPSDYFLVREILGSEFVPYSADNTKNIIAQQGLKPFQYNYLTDIDSWFLMVNKGQHKLNFFWREKPTMADMYDERNRVALFMTTSRFSVGATDWRGIYGSTGA